MENPWLEHDLGVLLPAYLSLSNLILALIWVLVRMLVIRNFLFSIPKFISLLFVVRLNFVVDFARVVVVMLSSRWQLIISTFFLVFSLDTVERRRLGY